MYYLNCFTFFLILKPHNTTIGLSLRPLASMTHSQRMDAYTIDTKLKQKVIKSPVWEKGHLWPRKLVYVQGVPIARHAVPHVYYILCCRSRWPSHGAAQEMNGHACYICLLALC